MFIYFVGTFLFVILDHSILHAMISLCFDLSAPTRRTAVLFLKSKTSVNIWSDFLALIFLKIIRGPDDIGLLSVNLSGVDTSDTSRINLNWSWSPYLTADVYSFLMFFRHICYHIAQFFNDGSIPMVTIFCFSWSDCNKPLRMTHCCSNDSISRIK